MEKSTIQELIQKQTIVVEEKRQMLLDLSTQISADLNALMKDLGFPQCEVLWNSDHTKFQMPRKGSNWAREITLYTYERYRTYEEGEEPTLEIKMSWSSSECTPDDVEEINYVRLMGKLAEDMSTGGLVLNTVLNKNEAFKQMKKDLNFIKEVRALEQLEKELKDTVEKEKSDAAMDAIYEGAEFLVLKKFNQGRRFYANKDTALRITKVGRKNLHVANGWLPVWQKKRNQEIQWDSYTTYMSIETLRWHIQEGYLLPC